MMKGTRNAFGSVLAALLLARPALAQFSLGQAQGSPTPPEIRDIRPPLDVFPYPMWMIVTAGVIAMAVLVLIGILIGRAIRNLPKAPPPTPREIALRKLEEAGTRVGDIEPYAFSILVSDILREYVSERFGLHAREQTSPEFLAQAANSPHFTGADKRLLAEFLEHCDMIKFARVAATVDDSRALLVQAVRFVKGEIEEAKPASPPALPPKVLQS